MDDVSQGSDRTEISETGLRQFLIHGLGDRGALLSSLVRECCSDTESREGCGQLLAQSVLDLSEELSSHREYRSAVEAASSCDPSESQPWCFHLLSEAPVFRIGLLTLFRFAPIPIHDHPGAYGAQLVLSGKARVRQYERQGEPHRNPHIVTLDRVTDQELSAGDCSSYSDCDRNLHELDAMTNRCVLLSLMVHPHREAPRSWYFPAALYGRGRRGVYSRVEDRGQNHWS